jgi:hypothetical protein
MMDWSNWFRWDSGSILWFFILGLALWLLGQTKEVKDRVKNPLLLGMAGTLIGWFEVGLYCLISLGLFLTVQYSITHWFGKYFKKLEVENEKKE